MEVLHHIFDFIMHIDKHIASIVNEYHTLTYLILFLIIFAETGFVVTPFLPGDSLLFATGALIAGGKTDLDIMLMFVVLCAAAILGDALNYKLGGLFGPGVFKEKNRILKLKYYLDAQSFFKKHGAWSIVLCRFVPIFRTIAPFIAGVAKMPFLKFLFYNVIGGISWIMIMLFSGFFFGQIPWFKAHFDVVVLIIIGLSLIPALWVMVRSKLMPGRLDETAVKNDE